MAPTASDRYFAEPGVNWSTLKHLRDSPLAYRHALANPPADRTAFAIGRAVHTLVFEPALFAWQYAIYEGGTRRGKDWDAFKALHAGQTILKPEEAAECEAMAQAVRQHPVVQPYLEGGVFEQAIFWTDPATGLACKGKPDWMQKADGVLLDLKTARSIEARRFGTEAARMGYPLQLAHYRNGIREALGWEVKRQMLVAVEKTAPYDVAVFEISPDDAWGADLDVGELLQQLLAHRNANRWPGRYAEEQWLQLPAWVNAADEDLGALGLEIKGDD